MEKYRQVFVSSRIQSQTNVGSKIQDQNNPNHQIKRQSRAPPKYKYLSSNKIQSQKQVKQVAEKNVSNQILLEEKKKGKLNSFCIKHISTLKKQFPFYFQSILTQLRKEGSVSIQNIQEVQIQQNQEQMTSFSRKWQDSKAKSSQQILGNISNKNDLGYDSINSYEKEQYQRYNMLKENLDQISPQKWQNRLKQTFDPYEQSNIAQKSSFQNIHLNQLNSNHQQNNLEKKGYQQNENSVDKLSENIQTDVNKNELQKLLNLDQQQQVNSPCNQISSSSESDLSEIKEICQKHMNNLDKVIEQVKNIKTQLLNDVKQIIQRSRSKKKMLKQKPELKKKNKKIIQNLSKQSSYYHKNQIDSQKYNQNQQSSQQSNVLQKYCKLEFPKVPRVLTMQIIKNQLKKDQKKQNSQLQNLNEIQPREKKKRRSSPLKNVNFAEELHFIDVRQTIVLKRVKCDSNYKEQSQINKSKQISFNFQSQEIKSILNTPSNLFNINFSQAGQISCNSQNQRKLPKRFKKLTSKVSNSLSGNQILIFDSQNPELTAQNNSSNSRSRKQSIYLHRQNSINRSSLMNSFVARLSDQRSSSQSNKKSFMNQQHYSSQNQNKIDLFQHNLNCEGIDLTKIDYQYSQSQIQNTRKIIQMPQKIFKKDQNILCLSNFVCSAQEKLTKKQEQLYKPKSQKINDQNIDMKFQNILQNSLLNKYPRSKQQQQSNKDTMLLSSYESQNYYQNARQNNFAKQNYQNSNICTQYNPKNNKIQKSFFSEAHSNTFITFSDQSKENINCLNERTFDQNQNQLSFCNISQTSILLTPPNIKNVKQRVMEYKKVKQLKARQQKKKVSNKKLQFSKNMQILISNRKLKFKKVQQKRQDIKVIENTNKKDVSEQQNQKIQLVNTNKEQIQKTQIVQQNKLVQKIDYKEILIRNSLDLEQLEEQIKKRECIYYEKRRKQTYKYPWVKFK